jgi:UDP-N-acetylmuramate--alanine ligase
LEFSGRHIYFLGIAGIGVSALAQVAQARGSRVSGADPYADPADNPAVARLLAGGATLYRQHLAANLAPDMDLVVASAAVPADNPELRAARERGLRIVSRAEFLGELMDGHRGPTVAVAGTHGKTTTTAMIGVMLRHCGPDPTVFVGGEVPDLGGNVTIGSPTGPFVAEACEAYDSFLSLRPQIAVITNIEADHLDHYGDLAGVEASFVRFAANITTVGVFNGDDPGIRNIIARLPDHISYRGYSAQRFGNACSRAENIVLGPRPSFDWVYGDRRVRIELNVPGRHNIINALAAATLSTLIANGRPLPMDRVAAGLAAFHGATRRQEVLGESGLGADSVLVMDDYAHHPTEIRATLDALRAAYPQRRLVIIFQPHLYSRTRDFLPEFATALAQADLLVVTAIYPAREAPIAGVDAEEIVALARRERPGLQTLYVPEKRAIPATLAGLIRPGDLAVFMGAGDIRAPGEAFVQLLQQQLQQREVAS